MDYNGRTNRAHTVDDFLKEDDICRMNWLLRSSDLRPIEHVWDGLQRATAQHKPYSRTHHGIKAELLEEWDLLPQTFIETVRELTMRLL